MMRYGRKGGDGPNAGKKATIYVVTFPDGNQVKKRDFNPPVDPVGYAYKQGGHWYLAAVGERNDPRFSTYVVVKAEVYDGTTG